MMLKDLQTGDLYVQVARDLADELGDWSEPVQIRIENGYVMLRNLAQPVKGVYIVDDERPERYQHAKERFRAALAGVQAEKGCQCPAGSYDRGNAVHAPYCPQADNKGSA